jgi:hypothetical protein
MVQAENINSGYSNSQLGISCGRHHHTLAHLWEIIGGRIGRERVKTVMDLPEEAKWKDRRTGQPERICLPLLFEKGADPEGT